MLRSPAKPVHASRCVAPRARMAAALAITLTLLTSPCAALEEITYPFQGVTLIHRTETSPRKLDIWVALIDTLAPGIRFQATPESPHAPDTVIAQTTRSFMTEIDAQLAINGDFYSSAGTINGLVHRNPSNFAASLGNIYSTFEPSRPALHIGKNNVAHTVTGSGSTPSPSVPVWNAVGGSDALLQNGFIPTTWRDPSFANALHPRTAVGINADRSKVALFVVDGRQAHSGGMNLPEIADMLLNDYGMHWAINLDGGGSTTMSIDDTSPRTLNRPSDGTDRSVANSLALFARPTPPPIPSNASTRGFRQETGGYSHTAAQINSGAPDSNNSALINFRVGFDQTAGKSRGVLAFDFDGIPRNATIHSVSLTLDAFSANGVTSNRYVDLELYQLTDPIVEDEVTWNRSAAGNNWATPGGDFSGQPLSTLYAQNAIGMKTFVSTIDFVAAAQQALNAGTPLSLLVAAPDAEAWGAANGSNLNMRFRSDDAFNGSRPVLTIHYTPAAGDFNVDGVVDASDFVVWRKGLGVVPTEAEYESWRSNFGTSPVGGSLLAVPEPAAYLSIGAAIALTGLRILRARR